MRKEEEATNNSTSPSVHQGSPIQNYTAFAARCPFNSEELHAELRDIFSLYKEYKEKNILYSLLD